jgi:hypothetical protein
VASQDAAGSFVVDVRHDEQAGDQTFLVAQGNGRIGIADTTAAVVVVEPVDTRRSSVRR